MKFGDHSAQRIFSHAIVRGGHLRDALTDRSSVAGASLVGLLQVRRFVRERVVCVEMGASTFARQSHVGQLGIVSRVSNRLSIDSREAFGDLRLDFGQS